MGPTDQTQSGTPAPLADATTPASATEVLREWRNPTPHEVHFVLHTSRRRRVHDNETGLFLHEIDENVPHEIRIPPGGTAKLLSRWDDAIQRYSCTDAKCEGRRCTSPTTHKGVTVTSGLAPQLERLDLVGVSVHPGLLAAPLGPSKPAAIEDDLLSRARRRKAGAT